MCGCGYSSSSTKPKLSFHVLGRATATTVTARIAPVLMASATAKEAGRVPAAPRPFVTMRLSVATMDPVNNLCTIYRAFASLDFRDRVVPTPTAVVPLCADTEEHPTKTALVAKIVLGPG